MGRHQMLGRVVEATRRQIDKKRMGGGKGELQCKVIDLFQLHRLAIDTCAGWRRETNALVQDHLVPPEEIVVGRERSAVGPLNALPEVSG